MLSKVFLSVVVQESQGETKPQINQKWVIFRNPFVAFSCINNNYELN